MIAERPWQAAASHIGALADAQSYARAMLNILEDAGTEAERRNDTQRAFLNILDDADDERGRLADTQRAVLNVLDDAAAEADRLADTQRAVLNILDDAAAEADRLADTQRAVLNILDDAAAEADRLADTQRAVLNILDDVGLEKANAERAVVALQHANAEVETANRELEAFSYSVAHDLRAPLRSIDGFSQALIEDYDDKLDEGGRTYLRFVREGALHMAGLINDLLGLARISRAELKATPIDLAAIAQATIKLLRRAQPERTVELIAPATMPAFGDRRLLAVVLENLIGNAWKFTGKTERPRIELGQMSQDGRTVNFVRDNGAGFDMAYSDKLFAVFQRLHSVGEFEGLGIGLATVQRVILRHGGQIWAEGEVDLGATFYFTLSEAP